MCFHASHYNVISQILARMENPFVNQVCYDRLVKAVSAEGYKYMILMFEGVLQYNVSRVQMLQVMANIIVQDLLCRGRGNVSAMILHAQSLTGLVHPDTRRRRP